VCLDFCSVGFGAGGFFPFDFLGREDDGGLEGLAERLLLPLDDPVLTFAAMLLVMEVVKGWSRIWKIYLCWQKVSPMPRTSTTAIQSQALFSSSGMFAEHLF
jgi:hypothetical protein